jgi:hypothetical protein
MAERDADPSRRRLPESNPEQMNPILAVATTARALDAGHVARAKIERKRAPAEKQRRRKTWK